MIALMGRFGRLGNQLWTYSNVLAFAMGTGARVINPAFQSWPQFKGSAGLLRDSKYHHVPLAPGHGRRAITRIIYKSNVRARLFPFVQLGEDSLLDMDAIGAGPVGRATMERSLVFLSGFYFFAPESLHANKAAILEFFSLIEPLQGKVMALARSARKDADVVVGVHMRHGDYRSYCDGIMYYSPAEYRDVMRCLQDQFPKKKVAFLICSDERQDPQFFEGLSVTCSSEEPVVDMYALALCDYVVGPNSTFSHWASFAGNVPLHILDWRAAVKHGTSEPIFQPDVSRHFQPFTPWNFGKYAARHVSLQDAMRWRRAG